MRTTHSFARPRLRSKNSCLRIALEVLPRYEADNFPVWIVSDCRRESDLRYFSENFGDRVKRVRIVADDKVREER